MNTTPLWNTGRPVRNLQHPFQHPLNILNNLERQFASSMQKDSRNASIDIVENDDSYEVIVEAVGLKAEQITIEALGKIIKITGTNATTDDQPRTVRTINYQVTMPGQVKVDEISAHLEDGLLTLKAPKVAPVEGRIVPVNAK